ncbi:MAG TPA: O-antigen ligase family protein [Verrucomicrobiae bacterium]|nr:O-antigen ligase family protein [Verrucomicrobiae bacterium]
MELTEQRARDLVQRAIRMALVVAVSLAAGWWVPRVHYLVALASLAVIGLAFFALTKPELGVYGLIFFAQIATISGLVFPLPMGLNEFNLIFATLVFVYVGEYAVTKRWTFQIRERTVGNYLYLYFAVILVSSLRAYENFPHYDFVRSGLAIASHTSVLTSQFVKPVMYVGLFFFGYNHGRELGQRRRFAIALGCCLVLYSLTMFLQLFNIFPILHRFASGKEEGGILGGSIALGDLWGMWLVLFLARKPYFDRGLQLFFGMGVAIVGIVAVACTLVRTAWVLCMLGWLMLAMTTRRKPLMIFGVLSLAVVLATSPLWLPERVKVYFEASTLEARNADALLSGRVSIWGAVFEYLNQVPTRYIWGGGRLDFTAHGPELGLGWGFTTHENLFETLVAEGMIGVIIVLWIFARIVPTLWRDWHNHPSEEVRSLARVLLIVTVLLFGSAVPWDAREASWYWFMVGVFLAAREDWSRRQPSTATAGAAANQPRLVRAGAMALRPASAASTQ